MFKLVVMLFAITNGVMAEHPSGQLRNKTFFATEKECMEFLESEQGARSRLSLEELIEEKKGTLGLKIFCVQDGALKEDDAI